MEEIHKIETELTGHWVNDNEFTRPILSMGENKIQRFIESLNDQIESLKGNLETFTPEGKQLLNDIELNDFESKFNIISGRKYSTSSQKWIGYVTEIKEKTFVAKLIDKSNKGTNEIGEFSIDELSPDDISLFRKDAIFYWSVGYSMTNGQKKSESILKFKRSVIFEEKDYNRGLDIGNDIFEGIVWED